MVMMVSDQRTPQVLTVQSDPHEAWAGPDWAQGALSQTLVPLVSRERMSRRQA